MENYKTKKWKRPHATNSTRVKVVCYYSHRTDGTAYTHADKLRGMNRKPHDIYEFIYTEHKKPIVREDLSVKKAKRHIEKHKQNIISALIYVNDWNNNMECLIGKFHMDKGMQFTEPEYTEPDVDGNIRIKKIISIQRDEMRRTDVEFKIEQA